MSGAQQTLTGEPTGQPWEYQDDRGIKVADADWDCPNCVRGRLMYRPGSKETCATCFHVVDGRYNTQRLSGYALKVPEAQRVLAAMGEKWNGSPGDLGTRLRNLFSSPEDAEAKYEKLPDVVGVEHE